MSLKTITMVMVGGLLVTLIVFWAVTSATADTSASFQTANLGFEKAVSASDVVVGVNTNRVGILTDTTDGKCQVATWEGGSRGGDITLRVETTTVAGVCTSTTALIAAGAGAASQELLSGIKAPLFTYSNLGGREITFGATGAAVLATGTMPTSVTVADWNDTRPYKVALNLETLSTDAAAVTKKAVLSAFTNVVNIAAAADDLRYVPAPSTDPVPGPLHITGVDRSSTTGALVGGVHEGLSVSFAGGVCPAGPTKVSVSYTQQGPSAAPAVSTVINQVLTGSSSAVQLGSVANGASGAVDVSATCVDSGVAEKDSTGYTQSIPATVLTVTQNAAPEKHNLSWTAVSSLPTSFQVSWYSQNGTLTTNPPATSALSMTTTQVVGSTFGLQTSYWLVATVDSTPAPSVYGNITTPWPAASPATGLWYWAGSPSVGSYVWTNGAACPAGTTRQTRSDLNAKWDSNTNLNWADYLVSAWSTDKFEDHAATDVWQGYPFQFSVHTKCASPYSESAIAYTQSATTWNTWDSPRTPEYNAYTQWQKVEQPAGSVYDVCRNHGTVTCTRHPGYNWSIQLVYRNFCPSGSTLAASNVHSRSWSGGQWDNTFDTLDGWETGGANQQVWYNSAVYTCKTPWGNTSPNSGVSGETMIWVWGW
ncbi:hypothetical protein [Cryobacterium zhongshanensis]|uniref:Uncharacterized protein n=1 Tax=Cryobacterium zhongshanensis TaxID=2928153 RepID=A0AA41QZ83_9MICO|nr:hypothetical protein [Cryobacterium zhongshanensis]MCI4659539.1 hypothetical protein [Cryobacterium zhongshanensis]